MGFGLGTLKDIGILMGVDSYRLAASVFQSSDAEESALSYMTRQGESVMTNSRMPAKASHIQKGILVRRGRVGMTTAVAPSWGAVQIDDQYSGALKGERYLTVAVLVGDLTIVQPGAYAELQFRGECLVADSLLISGPAGPRSQRSLGKFWLLQPG